MKEAAKSNTLRRLVRRVIRHVGPYEQTEGHGFKVEFILGDEAWSASIHFHHTWRGRFYWQCWFLPWFPSPPNAPHQGRAIASLPECGCSQEGRK